MHVSTTSPLIQGKIAGLYIASTSENVNFYDGVIKGKTAIVGSINEIEGNDENLKGGYTYSGK